MVIDFPTLQHLTGYKRPADVVRCLRNQGVAVFFGRKYPFTTTEALNNGLNCKQVNEDPLQFDADIPAAHRPR
jgi:hypothetical protein